MIRLKCPGCGKVLKAPDSAAGKVAKCKQCDKRLRIPELPAKAETPKPGPTGDAGIGGAGLDDSLFGDLPEFSAPPALVAKPRSDSVSHLESAESESLTASSLLPDAFPSTESNVDSPEGLSTNSPDDFANALDQAVDLAARDHQSQLKRNKVAASAKLTKAQVAASFGKAIDPISKSAGYSSSLTKVATTMVVLPAFFIVSVIVGTVVLTWMFLAWCESEPTGQLLNPIVAITFVTAVAFLLAAWVPVINMLMACVHLLFSRSGERPGTRALSREEQPVLYEFVEQICEKLDAPPPTRIDLDCDYNASASFDRGWLSFSKKEYVLTLGVPLIASQSAEQLSSVIAHEFGHFCQSGGMRAHYLIRHLNGWFINAAINKTIRDEVNDYIAANSDLGGFGMIWTIYYWIGWVGRQMMFLFGRAGHGFSGSLSREMEYDADKYAVHLAGSKNFANSMKLVSTHGVAYGVTVENLKLMFQDGILVNNIPRFAMYVAKTMPAATIRRIEEQTEKEKQDRYDSHPPTRDRITAANALDKPGIVQMKRPAFDLVNHWTKLCESITLDFYTGVTGQKVSRDDVSKLEDVLAAEHKLLLDKTV